MTSMILAVMIQWSAPAQADVRPEVATAVARASALVLDFEEEKALKDLDQVAGQGDLSPTETARVQLWRGVALMSLHRPDEARSAFALTRGCDPLSEPPKDLSPKIRTAFLAAAPVDCPVSASTPALRPEPDPVMERGGSARAAAGSPPPAHPAVTPQPGGSPAATAPAEPRGAGAGPPWLAIGGGVLLAPAGILVLGAVVVLGAAAVLGGLSAALHAAAVAEPSAVRARQQGQAALGLAVGGVAVVPLVVILSVLGLGVAAAGAALVAAGLAVR